MVCHLDSGVNMLSPNKARLKRSSTSVVGRGTVQFNRWVLLQLIERFVVHHLPHESAGEKIDDQKAETDQNLPLVGLSDAVACI
jgi:hypothetical protein